MDNASLEVRSITQSEDETIALGRTLGEKLLGGEIILITGELGAGKTRLVQGIAQGLGTDDNPRSPTFVLVTRHIGRLVLHHCDLYRLNSAEEVDDLGLLELAEQGDVLAIEWPERGDGVFPADSLKVKMVRGSHDDERLVSLSGEGPVSRRLIESIELTAGR
ncbi:MAG: tRNA (adenosine(37)-N6)-threonylcarbamoyltransferase complex ATPase subunit type 1 TsaE [Chloroflexi bacterium]|nr:tRNA (adenosine(37)-N6)-threonylcarbamoyltransferase complex ATPase subunit type 1 TsaE [Chloroflexota bacterium]